MIAWSRSRHFRPVDSPARTLRWGYCAGARRFRVLNWLSEYGLSSETCGRFWGPHILISLPGGAAAVSDNGQSIANFILDLTKQKLTLE